MGEKFSFLSRAKEVVFGDKPFIHKIMFGVLQQIIPHSATEFGKILMVITSGTTKNNSAMKKNCFRHWLLL